MTRRREPASLTPPTQPVPPALSDELPEGFKMTELGPLPEEWEVVKLGEVATVGPSRIPRQSRDVLPFIPMSLIPEGGGEISQYELRAPSDVRSGVVVSEGDLLLAKITPCLENEKQGIVKNIPGGWGYATTEVFPLRANDRLEIEFLNYYLLQPSVREALASKMEGTTGRQRLPRAVVVSLPMFLPSVREQRAIAHVLRTVQRAKEATERIIGALKELKNSLMQHLFTYGPVPVDQADQVRLKETEIGPVPEEWEVLRLGEVALQAFGGGTPSTNNSLFWGGPIPWTTSAIIGEDDVELRNFQRTISEKGLKRSSLAPKGSLLIGTRVGVGKAVVAAFDIAINQDLTAVVLHNKANPYYVALLLKDYRYQVWFTGRTRGTTIKGIPRRDLLNVPIPLPPLPEQRAIAETLRTVGRKIEAEESRKRALEVLFKTLLHHLMTGKVRVRGFHLPELERTP
jgi:type I restriction enzyme S subunit